MTNFRFVAALIASLILNAPSLAQTARDWVIVNPFEVKVGRDADCLAAWDKAAMILRDKPGFKSARLLKSSAAGPQSTFVTVGVWSSVTQYEAAVADPQFRAAFSSDTCAGSPAPYRAIREISGASGRPTNPIEPHLDPSNIR